MIHYDKHSWWSYVILPVGGRHLRVFYRTAWFAAWAAVVLYAHHYWVWVAISEKAHALIGVAVGLLLVFRTNAAYDRFWEGRKLWGSIINESRNLGRASSVLLAGAPDLLGRLLRWTAAFPFATMDALRGQKGLGPAAEGLPPAETAAALAANHVPLAVARNLTAVLAEARGRGLISDYVQMTLDHNVQLLVDYVGSCERIRKTPLPFAYVIHLRYALFLYCLTLPFALSEQYGWWTVFVTFVLTFVLLGIEEIGVEIENPFGHDPNDLPLEDFCTTVRENVLSFLPPASPTGLEPRDGELAPRVPAQVE